MSTLTSTPAIPKATANMISQAAFIGGCLSIILSIGIWAFTKGEDPAHAERFAIFVGLWAPTFFILSDRFKTRLA